MSEQQVNLQAEQSYGITNEDVYCIGPFKGTLSAGAWGCVTDGYLVFIGRTGRGYLLQPDGPLSVDYVQEKFNLETTSVLGVAYLIGRMIGREVIEVSKV